MIPRGEPLDPIALAAEIDREIRALPAQGVQPVRAVRRAWSRRLRAAPAEAVAALAMALVDRQRWVAYELVSQHPGGLDRLGVEAVRGFLDAHREVLAPRVTREVRSKLETGRKRVAPRAT